MTVRLTSPCDGCDARCCRVYVVPVSGDDAFRLARATGVPLHRLVACAPQREPDGPGFLLDPDGPAHVLVLAAQAGHPMAACAFLVEEGGGGRCGAYAARPRACRRFPAVSEGGRVGAREGTPCPPGAWSEAHLAGLSWRVALAREERELALYGEVVADWNARVHARGPATAHAFLDHLGETYAWLTRWRAALAPAERRGAPFLARARYALAALPR